MTMASNSTLHWVLYGWINEASKNLESIAVEKITQEATERFEKAFEHYTSSGLTETDARSRALEELGNPKETLKKYGKIYFGKLETQSDWRGGVSVFLGGLSNLLLFDVFSFQYNLNLAFFTSLPFSNEKSDRFFEKFDYINNPFLPIATISSYLIIIFTIFGILFFIFGRFTKGNMSIFFRTRSYFYSQISFLMFVPSRLFLYASPYLSQSSKVFYIILTVLTFGTSIFMFIYFHGQLQRRARALAV